MFLQRTAKAYAELAPGQRSLGLRERAVLLLAERTPPSELHAMYGGAGAALVQQLLEHGYLQAPVAPNLTAAVATEPEATAPTASVNLAGVRMHLFDLCERMFAKPAPDTAEYLRTLLREARDVTSMLQARDQLLDAVDRHAGAERADALRQQLLRMLPEHLALAAAESSLTPA